MKIRRVLTLALAAILFAATQVIPVISTASQVQENQIRLADGDFPPPTECGLLDICKVSANS